MNDDLEIALSCLLVFVYENQVHTRKGSRTSEQQPLADAAQSPAWRLARDLLVKHGRKVPASGTLMDG